MKFFYLFCALLLTNSAHSMNEVVSVDSILTHLHTAIENKNAQEVSYWHNSLKLLVGADWKFFDGNQITKYGDFYSKLNDKVNTILSQQRHGLNMSERLDKDMEEAKTVASWLIHKLEQNQCDVEWTSLLGQGTKTLPSPEILKKHRIQSLQETGSIKSMN